jgi:hypothetical protein
VRRPHYDPTEMDAECERIIREFLMKKYGKIKFPISTSDLGVLIESFVEDLDMGADLAEEEGDVEGVTEFTRGKLPTVKISRALVGDPSMENRLRTTLTHEFSHVTFHRFMFEVESKPRFLFDDPGVEVQETAKCKRANIFGAAAADWMEWQAGYGCGAFLMPIRSLIETVQEFRQSPSIPAGALSLISEEGQDLLHTVAGAFQVSRDAARVRLLQGRFLQDDGGQESKHLF